MKVRNWLFALVGTTALIACSSSKNSSNQAREVAYSDIHATDFPNVANSVLGGWSIQARSQDKQGRNETVLAEIYLNSSTYAARVTCTRDDGSQLQAAAEIPVKVDGSTITFLKTTNFGPSDCSITSTAGPISYSLSDGGNELDLPSDQLGTMALHRIVQPSPDSSGTSYGSGASPGDPSYGDSSDDQPGALVVHYFLNRDCQGPSYEVVNGKCADHGYEDNEIASSQLGETCLNYPQAILLGSFCH